MRDGREGLWKSFYSGFEKKKTQNKQDTQRESNGSFLFTRNCHDSDDVAGTAAAMMIAYDSYIELSPPEDQSNHLRRAAWNDTM